MTCQPEKCKSTFVTWVWLVGILTGIAVPSLIFAFKGGKEIATNEQKIIYIEKRLDKIDNIDNKIDKILKKLSE